ncbi:tyrosine-type recombinase/integrase [Shinella sp.]|uniref:tyrosine-type recombinase/integrase n=1 Tax=Shinella sp. TaxID=1870904 RepID=UPI003F72CD5D
MARELNRLNAKKIDNAPPGKHADGGGLWFVKHPNGNAQWFLRVTVHGRRREMGLGTYPTIKLAEARTEAAKWRALVAKGLDPINERERERAEAEKRLHLFEDVADDAFESRKAELKGDGKAGRWFSPLKVHVLPKMGKKPIGEIDQRLIRDTLAPIWHTKPEAARKALNRTDICMRHAAALGYDVDLQACEKAKALLGQRRHTPQNIPALPWQDVPAFYASLSDGTVTHLALRLLILTGVRSAPLRFMRTDQIDGDVWTIPGEQMKGRKGKTPDFRVPLVPETLAIIEQAKAFERGGYLFPSVRVGVISDATMSRLMERREMAARPHGFRSSLRDWIAETTDVPYDVAETVLGHIVGGKVERAYKRTDFLEPRRKLLERWANHVTGKGGQLLRLVDAG